MNRLTIRDNLVGAVTPFWTGLHPAVPMYFENTEPVDRDTLPDVFLFCALDFANAEQINIDPNPYTRYSGFVEFIAYTRATQGTRVALSYLEELADHFQYQTISGVHLGVSKWDISKAPPGWHGQVISIPFFADSNA